MMVDPLHVEMCGGGWVLRYVWVCYNDIVDVRVVYNVCDMTVF